MDQFTLATRLGTHRQTVSRYETGTIGITQHRLQEIAIALETTAPALLQAAEQGAVPPVRVSEPLATYSPTKREPLPPKAYERVYDYLSRMKRANVPGDMIEEAQRLMVEPLYSKLNKRDVRERSEEDLITDIDAMWSAIKEVVNREWGKQL